MRASRLLSILLILQARGKATAGELARELEVSERTIYRDVAELGAAGVPVLSERGDGGGYRLIEGYRTNLTGLTEAEAGSLLLAGAPAVAGELGLGEPLAAARLKLLAAVPRGLGDVATRVEERIHLDPGWWAHQPPREARHLRSIARAVWGDQEVRIVHIRGEGRPGDRIVSPLGLVHKTGSWYLVATCAGEPRVYRVDRIRSARPTGAPAERPTGFDLARFWASWERDYASSLPTISVRARLGSGARRYRDLLGTLAPRRVDEEPATADGWAIQTLQFDSVDVAAAALLALAPDIEVIGPPELRARVAAIAGTVAERHALTSSG